MKNLSPDRLELEEEEKPVTDMDIEIEEETPVPENTDDWVTTTTWGGPINWV